MYGLDFGLEALLFFGCALDGAGLLCVRLCARVRACKCKCECKCKGGGVLIHGMLLDEERGETHGDDIFVSLAESLESVELYSTGSTSTFSR